MLRKTVIFAALTTLGLPASGLDELSGRLFTTPAERVKLNQVRAQGGMSSVLDDESKKIPTSDQATLNGYVIRPQGKTTTWINDIPQDETDRVSRIKVVQKPDNVPLILMQTVSGQQIKVGVGDTVNMRTGNVLKVYEQPLDEAAGGVTIAVPVKSAKTP